MPEPFDYTSQFKDLPSPQAAFMGGFMNADQIDQVRKRNEAEKRALDLQAQMQDDLAREFPNPTVSGIRGLMIKYPALSEKYKPVLESATEEQRAALIQKANNVFLPLLQGDRETAIQQARLNEEAATNSGKPDEARSMGLIRKMVESAATGKLGDNMALGGIAMFLHAAKGDASYMEDYAKYQKLISDTAMAPSLLSEAESEAAIKANEAKGGTPLTDIAKLNADLSAGRISRQDYESAKKKATTHGALVNIGYSQPFETTDKATGERVLVQQDKRGNLRVVEGFGVGEKPMTESQSNALGFGTRAMEANELLVDLEKSIDPSSGVQAVKSGVPLIGNYLTPSEFQEYAQAKGNFISAVLRKESGAVIGKDEFDKEDKKYFPQPGDAPSVISLKAKSRETAVKVLEAQAGRKLPRKKIEAASVEPARPSGAVSVDDLLKALGHGGK